MTDLDLRLRDELDVLFPAPAVSPRWDDVVARARPAFVRRPLVLALAATVLVLGSAAAVTAALGGFDAWLSGSPGKPAGHADQQRFAAANGRTWAAFPASTRLRELLRTEVAGRTYVLFGFRSGSSVCLKLRAVSLGHSTTPACVPVSAVAHATAPVVPVVVQSAFEDRHAHPSAAFSFGIAADGVSRVDVRTTDGTGSATIGGNAYLFVEDEPNTGNRILGIAARGVGGRTATIDVGGAFGEVGPPPGPTHVQVRIRHPRIAWVLRAERRGFSARRLDLTATGRRMLSRAARFVKPDPYSNVVVGIDGAYCLVTVEGRFFGEGCSRRDDFFARGPINAGLFAGGADSAVVAGAAADGVARVVAFTADGQRLAVPLRDNLFAVRLASSQFPARVVGYDRAGRIAVSSAIGFGLRPTLSRAALRGLHVERRVTGPNGGTATLRVGPVVNGTRCWRLNATAGCVEAAPTGPWIAADLVLAVGRDLFVLGHVRAPVVRVRLSFSDGSSVVTRPTHGLFLLAIPRAQLSTRRRLAFALGLRADGSVQQRQGVLFKLPR